MGISVVDPPTPPPPTLSLQHDTRHSLPVTILLPLRNRATDANSHAIPVPQTYYPHPHPHPAPYPNPQQQRKGDSGTNHRHKYSGRRTTKGKEGLDPEQSQHILPHYSVSTHTLVATSAARSQASATGPYYIDQNRWIITWEQRPQLPPYPAVPPWTTLLCRTTGRAQVWHYLWTTTRCYVVFLILPVLMATGEALLCCVCQRVRVP